jgi:hypothetical protein
MSNRNPNWDFLPEAHFQRMSNSLPFSCVAPLQRTCLDHWSASVSKRSSTPKKAVDNGLSAIVHSLDY